MTYLVIIIVVVIIFIIIIVVVIIIIIILLTVKYSRGLALEAVLAFSTLCSQTLIS